MRAGREGCDAAARTGYASGVVALSVLFFLLRLLREGLLLDGLSLDRLSLNRLSFLLPQLKAAQQSCCVLESVFIECDHRTGGRVFGRSRTVSHDHLVARKFLQMILDFTGRDQLRAGDVTGVE